MGALTTPGDGSMPSNLPFASWREVGRSLMSLSCGTPAFCCSPSTVRKLVQSARSNLRFCAPVWLGEPALEFLTLMLFAAQCVDLAFSERVEEPDRHWSGPGVDCFWLGFAGSPRFASGRGSTELRPCGLAPLDVGVDVFLIDPAVASGEIGRNLALIGQRVEMALRASGVTRPFAHRQPNLVARLGS
jgi:hypothetical protein